MHVCYRVPAFGKGVGRVHCYEHFMQNIYSSSEKRSPHWLRGKCHFGTKYIKTPLQADKRSCDHLYTEGANCLFPLH